MKKLKDYRQGAIGALMDEYERAAMELKSMVEKVSEADYERIADPETQDETCRSIQTVMAHVVLAGYGYSNYLREQFLMESDLLERRQITHREIGNEMDKMLAYTVKTLDGRWKMTDEEMDTTFIKSRWGVVYNIEQLLEHAIVHILRNRRQIEKFLLKFEEKG